MTKLFNFALKIKGGGRRVAEAKSSDPATPQKFGTCTYRQNDISSAFTLAVVTSYHLHLHIKMAASTSQVPPL